MSKFLFAFNADGEVRRQFNDSPEEAIGGYAMTVEERRAITAYDFRALYEMGIHPLLLTALANGSGIPIPKYLEAIRSSSH